DAARAPAPASTELRGYWSCPPHSDRTAPAGGDPSQDPAAPMTGIAPVKPDRGSHPHRHHDIDRRAVIAFGDQRGVARLIEHENSIFMVNLIRDFLEIAGIEPDLQRVIP